MGEQAEYILKDDFSAVDAALWEWLDQNTPDRYTVRRYPRSSGSVRYQISAGEVPVITTVIRQLDQEHVIMHVHLTPVLAQSADALGFISQFVAWRVTDKQRPPNPPLPVATNSFTQLPPRKRPGKDPEPYTIWARAQAQAGRRLDDPTFLDEYMQQRSEDPNNQTARKRAYDTLRRTLRRAHKP